jgi:hypothetical protein
LLGLLCWSDPVQLKRRIRNTVAPDNSRIRRSIRGYSSMLASSSYLCSHWVRNLIIKLLRFSLIEWLNFVKVQIWYCFGGRLSTSNFVWILFWQARVFWPLLSLSRPFSIFSIFQRCLDSNPDVWIRTRKIKTKNYFCSCDFRHCSGSGVVNSTSPLSTYNPTKTIRYYKCT